MPARYTPIVIHTVAFVFVAIALLTVDRAAWKRPEHAMAVAT